MHSWIKAGVVRGRRAVVDRDELTAFALHRLQPGPHRQMPLGTTRDDPAHLGQRLRGEDLLEVSGAIFLRDDDDLVDFRAVGEGPQRVPDDRLPREGGEELVEAHPSGAASGNDDRAYHEKDSVEKG
jgi:hypothetical protein